VLVGRERGELTVGFDILGLGDMLGVQMSDWGARATVDWLFTGLVLRGYRIYGMSVENVKIGYGGCTPVSLYGGGSVGATIRRWFILLGGATFVGLGGVRWEVEI